MDVQATQDDISVGNVEGFHIDNFERFSPNKSGNYLAQFKNSEV
jgi:hypothetical protein